jgi:hypothetical protein
MTTLTPASSSSGAIDEKHGSPSEEVKPPMANLSEQEKEIIERQIDAPKLTVGYFALFRYASKAELLIMVIAFIASVAAGAVMPLMTVRTFLYCFKLQPGYLEIYRLMDRVPRIRILKKATRHDFFNNHVSTHAKTQLMLYADRIRKLCG